MLGVGPALAEPKAWDQNEVKRLAGEFAQSLAKISAAAGVAPPQETAMQQRTRDAAVGRLGSVHEAADGLAKRLANGWDRSDTQLYFEQVRELFDQARGVAGDAVAKAEQRSNLDAAEKLLGQLARYFDDQGARIPRADSLTGYG